MHQKKPNGEINTAELSRQILNSFNFNHEKPSLDTIRRYSSIDGERYNDLDEKYTEEGFCVPNSKIMG